MYSITIDENTPKTIKISLRKLIKNLDTEAKKLLKLIASLYFVEFSVLPEFSTKFYQQYLQCFNSFQHNVLSAFLIMI